MAQKYLEGTQSLRYIYLLECITKEKTYLKVTTLFSNVVCLCNLIHI